MPYDSHILIFNTTKWKRSQCMHSNDFFILFSFFWLFLFIYVFFSVQFISFSSLIVFNLFLCLLLHTFFSLWFQYNFYGLLLCSVYCLFILSTQEIFSIYILCAYFFLRYYVFFFFFGLYFHISIFHYWTLNFMFCHYIYIIKVRHLSKNNSNFSKQQNNISFFLDLGIVVFFPFVQLWSIISFVSSHFSFLQFICIKLRFGFYSVPIQFNCAISVLDFAIFVLLLFWKRKKSEEKWINMKYI